MQKVITSLAIVLGLVAVSPAYASTFTPSAVCSVDPSTILNWHADNASSSVQSFDWERLTGLELGSAIASANGSLDFTTGSSGTTTPDTLRFSWDEGMGTTTQDITADVTPCVPVVLPTPVPTPVFVPEVIIPSLGGGGHASNAEMQALLSPSDYQVYLAHKAGQTTVSPAASTTVEDLMKQIINLLEQEIALVQAGQQ